MSKDQRDELADASGYINCPACRGMLLTSAEMLQCTSCRAEYVIEQDVICLGAEENAQYLQDVDGLSPEQLDDMSAAFEGLDVERAESVIKEKYPIFCSYLFDPGRADWRFFVDLPRDARVLDLGCGWGNIAFELAREYGHVAAMDVSRGKLQFLALRSKAAGVENIDCINADFTEKLPFGENQFDLIILNGVLEWVGAYSDSASPSQCQKRLLREILRVLKTGGSLYIGIENRYGYEYFLGKRDDHSLVTYTSLLPRFLANRRMKKHKGRQYRTYTYSYRGLKRLLRNSGFREVTIAYSSPDYKYFTHIVPLGIKEMTGYFQRKMGNKEVRDFLSEQTKPEFRLSKILKRIIVSAAYFSPSAVRENVGDLRRKMAVLPREILLRYFMHSLTGTRWLAPSFSVFAQK